MTTHDEILERGLGYVSLSMSANSAFEDGYDEKMRKSIASMFKQFHPFDPECILTETVEEGGIVKYFAVATGAVEVDGLMQKPYSQYEQRVTPEEAAKFMLARMTGKVAEIEFGRP